MTSVHDKSLYDRIFISIYSLLGATIYITFIFIFLLASFPEMSFFHSYFLMNYFSTGMMVLSWYLYYDRKRGLAAKNKYRNCELE